MSSNAGTLIPDIARRLPVRIMESGPTAGALMASHLGETLSLPNLLSYDTGGTTSKGCLIHDGKLRKRYEMETAQVHEFKKGSGLVVKTPVVDMIEIGAGGGSIAEVDDRGLLRVGPRSSGADPGPACYGRGGNDPTLTDADLILGYLDADFFLGGSMQLHQPAAEIAITKSVGSPLGLDLTAAAWGIHETINENCARAFRMHASERMVDYRNCSMVAFGGSAPIRATRVARKLRIPRVIVPLGAGVFSAFGLLISPLSFDALRSHRVTLDALSPQRFLDEYQSLSDEAQGFLTQAGVAESDVRLTRRLDMRYEGQGFEVEVVLPDTTDLGALFGELPKLFSDTYARVFSMSFIEQPVEIVNWKVEARGPNPEMKRAFRLRSENTASNELKGHRMAYFPEQSSYERCPVYNRYALQPNSTFSGPAIIEERESTCVLGMHDSVNVDEHHNLIINLTYGKENG
jgi:N-methylhydantoinase A